MRRAQVEFFRFKDDQKRALLSRLLQRRCVSAALGLPWGKVQLKRTKAKKPYAAGAPAKPHAPNFNFNVSHEARADGLDVCVCQDAYAQYAQRPGVAALTSLANTTPGFSPGHPFSIGVSLLHADAFVRCACTCGTPADVASLP
jgi:hypothetical protein